MQMTEVYALAGALTTGMLSVLHFLVWRRQREPWSAYFALSYLLIGVVYAFDQQLQPVGDRSNLVARTIAVPAVLLFTLGLVQYVGVPQRAARRIAAVASAVALALLVMGHTGQVGRLGMFTGFAGFLTFHGLLALWAMRREPGRGHSLVFLAMMLYPAVLVAAWQGLIDVPLLRYAVIVPMVVSGTTVLTTGLLRAQQQAADELARRQQAEAALQSLNDTLEQRVAQRTAELREMVAGLESFNRSVSHDLRGPLGGIAGVSRLASEALARHDLPTVERMLAVIATQADSSGQLVNDLLALARVNDADLALQPIDLQAFVRDTLEQMRQAQPEAADLPVRVGELPTVEADPGLLRQVYVNLLGNALKFSREGAAPQVEVGAFERDGEQVCFVRDNGVGFDADEAERLFQPFQRLHGQRFPGHGVGLSIVKRIVERHGGRLWAQAKRHQGATFYFSLPSHH
ncbi:HAMP domain-containing sensor histidine kinase [Piscinibacter gummiphilus]|uniref:histidine kinase n=1 Tax=Piscinibacter gummiphilus TaxID=946333 RepID=A0ABZ0CW78_9BURK|nr:HAMP domain-containing sensor histidine kinase [Piscinibacter gummiphilus]WOB08766.1 HAMP domain-containing sensor histidine kinase [Piscinibacter gummiphilus]